MRPKLSLLSTKIPSVLPMILREQFPLVESLRALRHRLVPRSDDISSGSLECSADGWFFLCSQPRENHVEGALITMRLYPPHAVCIYSDRLPWHMNFIYSAYLVEALATENSDYRPMRAL